MRDERKWRLAIVQFRALHKNIPNLIQEQLVREYHATLDLLATASEEDLSSFQVPSSELKPRVTGGQIGSPRMPGRTFYSKDNYCDRNLFQRKLDSLADYLPHIEEYFKPHAKANASKDYSKMSDEELGELAFKNRIRAHADGARHVDRDMVIDGLREIERRSSSQPTHQVINYGTMMGSPIQTGPQASPITVNFTSNHVHDLVKQIRASLDEVELGDGAKEEVLADLSTIEAQLSSPNPKSVIIAECFATIRTIFLGVVGSLIATVIVNEIGKLLGN